MTVYKITGLLLGYSIVRPVTNFSPTMEVEVYVCALASAHSFRV